MLIRKALAAVNLMLPAMVMRPVLTWWLLVTRDFQASLRLTTLTCRLLQTAGRLAEVVQEIGAAAASFLCRCAR